ncbi:hypothetical protein KPK_1170 [Klebsiella variicola]|uniref:Uncharacterized protein n=1 Tax=Klebsiella variicola (strain 342) TaxID=507522 RepID=B5XVI5_KLEV3|nr:hypothetical protein KPK_1170 [Klebsiella variicola]
MCNISRFQTAHQTGEHQNGTFEKINVVFRHGGCVKSHWLIMQR